MNISSVDIRGKIEPINHVNFIRVEWTYAAPHFALLRYEIAGKEQDFGVRMDMDKRMLMEDLEDPALNRTLRERSPDIWRVVVGAIGNYESSLTK